MSTFLYWTYIPQKYSYKRQGVVGLFLRFKLTCNAYNSIVNFDSSLHPKLALKSHSPNEASPLDEDGPKS